MAGNQCLLNTHQIVNQTRKNLLLLLDFQKGNLRLLTSQKEDKIPGPVQVLFFFTNNLLQKLKAKLRNDRKREKFSAYWKLFTRNMSSLYLPMKT